MDTEIILIVFLTVNTLVNLWMGYANGVVIGRNYESQNRTEKGLRDNLSEFEVANKVLYSQLQDQLRVNLELRLEKQAQTGGDGDK